ncbi:hypothetical protein USB125703_02087 [Pseudoclavibacter triregionum]|nr:hypothetical protein USB125703_02087 [Pseudoclavibacter triregionum]
MTGEQEQHGPQEPHVAASGLDAALAPELDRIAGLPLAERAAALGAVHERLRAELEETPSASAPEGA